MDFDSEVLLMFATMGRECDADMLAFTAELSARMYEAGKHSACLEITNCHEMQSDIKKKILNAI